MIFCCNRTKQTFDIVKSICFISSVFASHPGSGVGGEDEVTDLKLGRLSNIPGATRHNLLSPCLPGFSSPGNCSWEIAGGSLMALKVKETMKRKDTRLLSWPFMSGQMEHEHILQTHMCVKCFHILKIKLHNAHPLPSLEIRFCFIMTQIDFWEIPPYTSMSL